MHGIAAAEQHQRARRDRKRHRRFIAVENSRNPVEIHLAIVCVAKIADILERAAILGRLQQQRHGKGGIVEMPAKLLTLAGIMHIDRGQRVGIFVKRILADHLRQKRAEFR